MHHHIVKNMKNYTWKHNLYVDVELPKTYMAWKMLLILL